MKIKNKDLRAVCTALFNLGNHQGDITKKWAIAKITKKFNDANALVEQEVNALVEKKGKENDKGQKQLSPKNKDYLKLMELESEVDFQPFTLTQLDEYNPTVQELLLLESIIEESEEGD